MVRSRVVYRASMRAFVAYMFAVLAVCAGLWFGYFAKNEVAGKESRRIWLRVSREASNPMDDR